MVSQVGLAPGLTLPTRWVVLRAPKRLDETQESRIAADGGGWWLSQRTVTVFGTVAGGAGGDENEGEGGPGPPSQSFPAIQMYKKFGIVLAVKKIYKKRTLWLFDAETFLPSALTFRLVSTMEILYRVFF